MDEELVLKRAEFIANRNFIRSVLNDILTETINIINCLEDLDALKLYNKSVSELALNVYFIKNIPSDIIQNSRWLQGYTIYKDVNILKFKEASLCANEFVDTLMKTAIKYSTYFETQENKSLYEKLDMVSEVLKMSQDEFTEKMKYNLAFQLFPHGDINILAGRESFAREFACRIISDATDIVKPRGKHILDASDVQQQISGELEEIIGEREVVYSAGTEVGAQTSEDPKQIEKSSPSSKLTESGANEEEKHSLTNNTSSSIKLPEHCTLLDSISLPLIKDFNLREGKSLAEKIISEWCLDKQWKYSIHYYDYSHDKICEYHKYEVIFSIPTPKFPIPQATASVFFTVTVNRIQHDEFPIEVAYNMEGSKYIHHINEKKFNQDWLYAILCNKIKFFKRILSMNSI